MRDLSQIAPFVVTRCQRSSSIFRISSTQSSTPFATCDLLSRDGNFRRIHSSRIIQFFLNLISPSLSLSLFFSRLRDCTREQLPRAPMNSPFGSLGLRSFIPDINDAEGVFTEFSFSFFTPFSLYLSSSVSISPSFTRRREPHVRFHEKYIFVKARNILQRKQ